jgi:hypothetical protein
LDLWLTAHLTDFLHHCGLLDTLLLPASADGAAAATIGDVRAQWLGEYGTALLADRVHWPLGVAYLRACGDVGLATLEAVRCAPLTAPHGRFLS